MLNFMLVKSNILTSSYVRITTLNKQIHQTIALQHQIVLKNTCHYNTKLFMEDKQIVVLALLYLKEVENVETNHTLLILEEKIICFCC